MWLMLRQDKPEDYVIATGETHSVREFTELAFKGAGIAIEWEGEGINEIGRDVDSGRILVKVGPAFYRPTEVDLLIGDSSKARKKLGWKSKVSFEELVRMIIKCDLGIAESLNKESTPQVDMTIKNNF